MIELDACPAVGTEGQLVTALLCWADVAHTRWPDGIVISSCNEYVDPDDEIGLCKIHRDEIIPLLSRLY